MQMRWEQSDDDLKQIFFRKLCCVSSPKAWFQCLPIVLMLYTSYIGAPHLMSIFTSYKIHCELQLL